MRITIIRDDQVVGVDRIFRGVDLSQLDPQIHAIQFNTIAGVGHIEYSGAGREENVRITDFAPYQQFVDRWEANEPPPPPPPPDPPPPLDRMFPDVPANINSVPALRQIVADLVLKLKEINVLEDVVPPP